MEVASDIASDTSATPLQPSGSIDDSEPPRRWGSHTDKVCVLPFLVLVSALGYYGVQGVQSFNIYQYGAAQADALCSPLDGLQDQCRGKLAEEIAEAATKAQGTAALALRDGTQAALQMQKKAADACTAVEVGLSKCDVVHGFVSDGQFMHLPSIPTLAASSGSHELEAKTKSYVDSMTSRCKSISKDIRSACSKTNEAMESGGAKVAEAIQSLENGAAAKLEKSILRAVAKAEHSICPTLKDIPKACDSLKVAAKDALHEAEVAAVDALPKEVPHEVLMNALADANEGALSFVDGICKDVTDVAQNCSSFFSESKWRPVVDVVQNQLDAVGTQFKQVLHVVKEKIAGQCRTASSQVEEACSTTTDAAGAAASQPTAAASAKELQSLHDRLGATLSKVGKSLGVVDQGCSQVGALVKARCANFRNSRKGFTASAERVHTSLKKMADAGPAVENACDRVGSLKETCLSVANPFAILAKGGSALWQHRFSEIVQLEVYLLIGCTITAVVMLGVVRCATKMVVTISICFNLGTLLAITAMNLAVMNLPGAAMFGTIFLLKATWFWCIRDKFAFAVVLIHAGVETVEKAMGIGIWFLGLFLIALQVTCLMLTGGAWYHLMGVNAPPEAVQLTEISPLAIPVLLVFTLAWTVEVIANLLHVTVCCNLGAECGLNTPAKTVCGSFVFGLFGAIGSICCGSFMIALLKALQYVYDKGTNSKNPCVQVIVRAACCIIQWMLKLFNAYAFVFVGLKGDSYCDAAYRTAEAFAKDGMAAVAADEALHDVIHIAKLVSTWVSVLLSLIFGSSLNIIGVGERSWQEVLTGPVLCIAMGMATSYVLSMIMGRLLEATVCTLFIIFDDESYKRCLKSTKPEIFDQIQAAYDGKKSSGPDSP